MTPDQQTYMEDALTRQVETESLCATCSTESELCLMHKERVEWMTMLLILGQMGDAEGVELIELPVILQAIADFSTRHIN